MRSSGPGLLKGKCGEVGQTAVRQPGQHTQRSQHKQIVRDEVGLCDQVASDLIHGHDGIANLPAGGLHTRQRATMRAGHGVQSPAVVAVGDEFVDGVVDVGEAMNLVMKTL